MWITWHHWWSETTWPFIFLITLLCHFLWLETKWSRNSVLLLFDCSQKTSFQLKLLHVMEKFSFFISNIVICNIDKYNPLQSFKIKIILFIDWLCLWLWMVTFIIMDSDMIMATWSWRKFFKKTWSMYNFIFFTTPKTINLPWKLISLFTLKCQLIFGVIHNDFPAFSNYVAHGMCALLRNHVESRNTYLGIDSECSFKPEVFEDSDCSQQHIVTGEREIVEVEWV